jgi:hypothetical protein
MHTGIARNIFYFYRTGRREYNIILSCNRRILGPTVYHPPCLFGVRDTIHRVGSTFCSPRTYITIEQALLNFCLWLLEAVSDVLGALFFLERESDERVPRVPRYFESRTILKSAEQTPKQGNHKHRTEQKSFEVSLKSITIIIAND